MQEDGSQGHWATVLGIRQIWIQLLLDLLVM